MPAVQNPARGVIHEPRNDVPSGEVAETLTAQGSVDILIWSIGPFLLVFLVLLIGGAFSASGAGPARRPSTAVVCLLLAAGIGAGLIGLLIGR
jgi:uncharacterized membrane protein